MSDTLQPYPEYKDSGVPWLEQVPAHWAILRAKNVFTGVDVRSESGNEELLTVSSNDGVVPRREKTVTMFMAESYAGYKLCWPGDLVINSLWAWARGLGFARHHGIISSAYGVYRLRSHFSKYWRYLDYALRSDAYQWEFQVRSKGIWVSRLQLTDEAFFDMPVILPAQDEVKLIVHYLDHADLQIRRFIRAKRRTIDLLNEQKQAIIQHAVTRGLYPNVLLKPSSVEWLGDIPAHWEIRRAKQVCAAIVDCKNRTPLVLLTGDYIVVRTSNVRNGKLDLESPTFTDAVNYKEWTRRGAPKAGDVFFTREAPAGEACLVPENDNLCMGQRMMYFRPDPALLDPDFLLLNIYGPLVRRYIDMGTNGSTVGHLRLGQVYALPVLWCPLTEQHKIVAYVNSETDAIDRAITRTRREIDLIREYRTRLIADVVTGKIDVRAATQHLPSQVDEAELLDEGTDEDAGDIEEVEEVSPDDND